FRTPLRRLGARDVDVAGALGDLREDRDAIRLDLREPEGNREVVFLLALPVPQLPDVQRRQQRRVSRQDAEVALGAGDLYFVPGLVDGRPLRGHDLELQVRRERHRPLPVPYAAFRCFARSMTSSIEPAR